MLCKLATLSRRTYCIERYERFSWFLESCNCSKTELSFLRGHINAFESNPNDYSHVIPWFHAQENNQRISAPTDSQSGCFDIIPGLMAQPIWDTTQFDFVNHMFCRKNFIVIQNELISFITKESSTDGFQPYADANSKSNDKGYWNVLYFSLHDLIFEDNVKKFPKTASIINEMNQSKYTLFPHSLISCLSPDSHIIAHNGPTNKKLRVYVPLLLEEETNILKVDDKIMYLKEGDVLIFDDSFIHEAWNNSISKSRFTLIFDIWHPHLTQKEVQFLSIIQQIFERNLLEIARNNIDIGYRDGAHSRIQNPYVAMLNAQHSDISLDQIYSGWR